MLRVVLALALTGLAVAASEVKYCVPYDVTDGVIKKCTEVLSQANNYEVEFTCVKGLSQTGCMRMVSGGKAHLVTLDGSNLYSSWQDYDMLPMVSENNGNTQGFEYYGVAVVNKDFCDGDDDKIEKLRGKNACFTSFREEIVGWDAPIASLISSGKMQVFNNDSKIAADAESAAGFFNKICAPSNGGPKNGDSGVQESWERLCNLCKDGECQMDSDYAGYIGSFRCLAEGAGDVAFTKHTVPLENTRSPTTNPPDWSTKDMQDYRLVCPYGGCKELNEYHSCYWAKAPAHSMAGLYYFATEDEVGKAARLALVDKSRDSAWVESGRRIAEYDGVIFDDETISLDPVNVNTLSDYLDGNTFDDLQVMYYLKRRARFCVTDDKSLEQCNAITEALAKFDRGNSLGGFTWGCVRMFDTSSCMGAVAEKKAEMMVMDGGQLYEARNKYNLAPLVSEVYGEGSEGSENANEYYAVAVVNKDFCKEDNSAKFQDLRGHSSCHTGYHRSTGWWMPLAQLSKDGLIERNERERGVAVDAGSMSIFFDKMCAVGVADDGPLLDQTLWEIKEWDELCMACKDNCSTDDPYASFVGAFHCLHDGNGDVAFTKHTVPLNYASDGEEADEAEWSTKPKDDYRLLCPSGGCMNVDQYESCNLGKIPADVVAINHANSHKDELRQFLVAASEDSETAQKIFGDGMESFWGEAASKLAPVTSTAQEYLGDTWNIYEELYKKGWVGAGNFPSLVQNYGGNTTICIAAEVDDKVVEECTRLFKQADDAVNDITFMCVKGGSTGTCMEMVANGSVDWVMLQPRDQYYGIDLYGLQPVVSEDWGNGFGSGYSVGVVRKSVCDNPSVSLADLKGKDACMTGYDRFGGWHLPMGALKEAGGLDVVSTDQDIQPDAQSIAAYFDKVCAPGVSPRGPVVLSSGLSDQWEALCTGCEGGKCSEESDEDRNSQAKVDDADEGENEQMATLQCLNEQDNGVAFTLHTAVTEYSADGAQPQSWSKLNIDDVRLLCPSGGCKGIEEVDTCNFGTVPAPAIMARASQTAQWSPAVYSVIYRASTNLTWLNELKNISGYALVSPKANNLVIVSDYKYFWGEVTLENLEEAESVNKPNVTFCTADSDEYNFCTSVLDTMNAQQPHVQFDCYVSGDKDCVLAVKDGDADVAIVDSHDAYVAYEKHKLEPVSALDEGQGTFAQTAVAVVKKEWCDAASRSFQDLKGLKSCHTGYRRTAGYVLPIGFLMNKGMMDYVDVQGDIQNDAESPAAYFDQMCAPRVFDNGPRMTADRYGENWDEMCNGCPDDCTENSDYYDYAGAMRCLMEGKGDVAFNKHDAALDYAKDGQNAQSWSTLNQDDMRLLCPNGGCAALDDADACKIADVPGHAAVVRKDFLEKRRVVKALKALVEDTQFAMAVLNSTVNPLSYMLPTEAIAALPIMAPSQYFGEAWGLFKGFSALDNTDVAGR